MATTPPATPNDPRDDAFLREVDEAYREDVFRNFFAKWGRWILLAIGIGLAALGGWFWWQAEQLRKTEALSEQFTAALSKVENGATTEAMAELGKVAEAGNPSYRSLAAFTKAGIALNGGDTDKAIAEVQSVAKDTETAQAFRDAAVLKQVRLEFDKLAPAEILKRTNPYLTGDNPWFPVAGEMAALAHLKAGEPDKAGPLFYRLASDKRTPDSMRARAEQMAAALGQDVTKIAEERKQQEEAAAKAPPAETAPVPAEEAAK
ncbi:tetratricopeptide repeat protein [Sandaracinobacteroides hominis]|uniref:tetratricopeptide repeat protein n=1 Tax=Sandaracinobacteroides hominis TaxID=2780086 RepID=UPI0018F41009|nr:tetratricopeptide repeat protein [Sandaracinobacteroides hominis]